ncbi:hypothetical protein [Hymenobacter nivis]|uniref:hypothetical protein n=1 Tax=Hymenobacter nivis TaxID=1850093 RepID=UPI0013A5AA5E|nr:hypothetical protein [Hymenobacter nivis]
MWLRAKQARYERHLGQRRRCPPCHGARLCAGWPPGTSGHDVYYHDNRAVSSGYLPDGRRFSAGFCGLGMFNYYQ